MATTDVIPALRLRRPDLEREGVKALFVYGSRARGDNRPDSDVDLFIDYDETKPFSLFDLAGVKVIAEEALGLDCHVTTRDSLHPQLRGDIERHAIRVF